MLPEVDPAAAGAPAVLLLDVGQGDASLIILPGTPRRAVVVDCNDVHVVERHLADFAVDRLDAVIFTHLDLDHIRGGEALLRAWLGRVDSVFIDRDGRDIEPGSAAAELFETVLKMEGRGDRSGPTIETPQRRRTPIAEGPGWRVRIVAPHGGDDLKGARRTANEHSAVVRVERDTPSGVVAVLIGGDAPLRTWSALPPEELAAAVFRTSHHGGAIDDGGVPEDWSSERLYSVVAASDAVVSVGTCNRHGHPNADWRRPLEARPGCRVRCTQVTPACHPEVDRDPAVLRSLVLQRRGRAEPAWRHLYPSGRTRMAKGDREVPCSGTVAVALREEGALVFPPADAHDDVVDLWATPWCRRLAPAPAELLDPLDLLLDS